MSVELPDSINVAIVDLIDTCFSVCHGVVGWKTKDLNEAKAKLEREITAWNTRAYEPDQARIAELEAEVERLRGALKPFAAVYQGLPTGYHNDLMIRLSISGSSAMNRQFLTVRDFRTAFEVSHAD